MGDAFKYGLAALLGAAVGSAVTYKVLKTKYESIIQEEIESVKEVWEERYENADEDEYEEEKIITAENVKVDTNKPSISEYKNILETQGYTANATDYSKMSSDDEEEEKEEEEMSIDGITVIDPEYFGENEEYEQVVLYYYAGDGLLATEDDELLEDMEHKVGFEALETFGRYEDDAVHVRNDNNKTYYEILRDERKYSELYQ